MLYTDRHDMDMAEDVRVALWEEFGEPVIDEHLCPDDFATYSESEVYLPFGGEAECALEEVAAHFKLTRERIRQIQANALRKVLRKLMIKEYQDTRALHGPCRKPVDRR